MLPHGGVAPGTPGSDTGAVSARFVVLLMTATACVRPATVDCGDHLVCAGGQLCLHASDGTNEADLCVAPAQYADCRDAGRADGDECDDGHGRCYSGACLPITCGDHLVDPGTSVVGAEQCDDGNTSSLDHCSADCRSNEQCGNGVVDGLLGETCDDGNLLSHDGCNDGCTGETPRWTEVVPGVPGALAQAALAYLPSRGRVVLFGGMLGSVGGAKNETWEWNGTGWLQVHLPFSPPERFGHAMVYDAARRRVFLFGGTGGPSTITNDADTWEWDGTRWDIVAISGPGRSDHAMAYDPHRERTVLFGGELVTGAGFVQQYLGDTWEFDGSTWTKLLDGGGAGEPPGRGGASLAYDAQRDALVLFGGQTSTGYLGDTWVFENGVWTESVGTGPKPRANAVLVPDRHGLLLYGGTDGNLFDDAWHWDGTGWTDLGAQPPGPRLGLAGATDLARGRVVLHGGLDGHTWEWDGAAWTEYTPLTPDPLDHAPAAFDQLRHQAIVVAGAQTFSIVDGTWSSLVAAPVGDRTGAAMVFDVGRDRAVLFGGRGSIMTLNDTWFLSTGAAPAWTRGASGPPGREAAGMAYDSHRGVAVLFGGHQLGGELGDTWELDTAWHQRIVSPSPPPRAGAAIGYDPILNRTVLFGGGDEMQGRLSDTWEWDGTAWLQLHPMPPVPAPRRDATLTWNPARKRLTLIAGDGGDALGKFSDAWEWDGARWRQAPALAPPPVRFAHLAVPSSDGSGLMIYGGAIKGATLSDTWQLSWDSDDRPFQGCVAHAEAADGHHIGCDDPVCWWACTPLCLPGLPCAPTAPRCGDGTSAAWKTCELCPGDVGACPLCGDGFCEPPGETHASCPGDCTAP